MFAKARLAEPRFYSIFLFFSSYLLLFQSFNMKHSWNGCSKVHCEQKHSIENIETKTIAQLVLFWICYSEWLNFPCLLFLCLGIISEGAHPWESKYYFWTKQSQVFLSLRVFWPCMNLMKIYPLMFIFLFSILECHFRFIIILLKALFFETNLESFSEKNYIYQVCCFILNWYSFTVNHIFLSKASSYLSGRQLSNYVE